MWAQYERESSPLCGDRASLLRQLAGEEGRRHSVGPAFGMPLPAPAQTSAKRATLGTRPPTVMQGLEIAPEMAA